MGTDTMTATVKKYDGTDVLVDVGSDVWVPRDKYKTTIHRIEVDKHGALFYLYEGGGFESRFPLRADQIVAY